MSKLKIKLPYNYFHYYAFSILIACLSLKSYFFLLLFIPYFYLIRFYKYKYLVIFVGIIFIIYNFTFIKLFKNEPSNNAFIITKKIENDTYYTYYVKQNINKYVFYSNNEYNVGEILLLNYEYEKFSSSRTPNSFNLSNYYASKRIFYKLKVKNANVISSNNNLDVIKENIKEKLNKYPTYTAKYLKLFIFADDTFEPEYREARVSLGIIHLFIISGLHLNFLIMVIESLAKKFNFKVSKYVIGLVFFVYLWFADFQIGLFRAAFIYIIFNLFKRKGINRLDSLAITFIFLLVINPFYRFRIGFVLSFLISFILVITPNKKGLKERFIIHLKIIFSGFLIVSNLNGGIYPLSVIGGFVFSLVFPVVILPLVLISLIPVFNIITEPLLSGFSKIVLNLGNDFLIKIPYQNILSIIFYLTIMVYVLFAIDNKNFFKRSLLLVIYIIFLYVSPNFYFNQTIFFLDVGQGDATFIQNTNNKGNILIDANQGTLSFLKTLGNIKIDYFFITHGDSDHAIEAKDIIKEFQVNNIIVSLHDNSPLVKDLDNYNIKRVNSGVNYYINGISIEILGPLKKYNNLNNNSLVLHLKTDNKTILFTGDVEKEAIADLCQTYEHRLKSDILHVAHHGAKEGTSIEFLKYVNPKEAIISVGLNNLYNHPNSQTISNLETYNVKIFLTSKQQTIIKRKYRFSFLN